MPQNIVLTWIRIVQVSFLEEMGYKCKFEPALGVKVYQQRKGTMLTHTLGRKWLKNGRNIAPMQKMETEEMCSQAFLLHYIYSYKIW